MSRDFSSYSDWDLQARLQNPMGPAAALTPGQPAPAAPTISEVKEIQMDIRNELRSRGYSDEEIQKIEDGDFDTIRNHRLRLGQEDSD